MALSKDGAILVFGTGKKWVDFFRINSASREVRRWTNVRNYAGRLENWAVKYDERFIVGAKGDVVPGGFGEKTKAVAVGNARGWRRQVAAGKSSAGVVGKHFERTGAVEVRKVFVAGDGGVEKIFTGRHAYTS